MKFAHLIGKESITVIQKQYLSEYSKSHIYKVLEQNNIIADTKRIASYFCQNCNITICVLIVYFGYRRTPECTECSKSLILKGSVKMLFYYNTIVDHYLRSGRIYPITDPLFGKTALRELEFHTDGLPLFIRHSLDYRTTFHVVHEFLNKIPVTLCRRKYSKDKIANICSGLTAKVRVDNICCTCRDLAINQFDRGLSLAPRYRFEKPGKMNIIYKLFRDVKRLGNVSQACFLNGVNRCTYYRWRDRYTDIYELVMN